MTSRRRRRKRRPPTIEDVGPCLVVIIGIAVVFLLWFLGVALFYVGGYRTDRRTESSLSADGLTGFPRDVVDIWPDQKNRPELLASVLQSCLPAENHACQQRIEPDGSTRQRIGVLRPPGVFGNIFEDFVVRYVEMSQSEEDAHTMELLSTSHLDTGKQHSFTKILRPAILPLLLEAIDLAIYCSGGDLPSNQITVDSLLDVVRQIVRWHCRLSHVASDTALLTVAFDKLLAKPTQIEKELIAFLELKHDKQKDLHVDMEDIAKKAFSRFDDSSALILQMEERQRLTEGVNQIVTEELTSGSCHLDPFQFQGGLGEQNQVTEILGLLFDGDSLDSVCSSYPHALLCSSER